jgi:thioredoxin-related protein
LLLLISSFGYAQKPVLEPGIYKSNAKGQMIMLRVFEGNKYEMAVFHGKYFTENDTIKFQNGDPNISAFQIRRNKEAPFSSTLKIKIKPQNLMYASRYVYIGTQKEDDAVVEYKALADFMNKRGFSYADRQKELRIDVDKGKYLYLVDTNPDRNALVSKYQVDPNENEIEVDYDGNSLQAIELKGVINPETKKIAVMEGRSGRDILEFVRDTADTENADALKPLSVAAEKDWKKNHGFAPEYEFDSSYLEKRPKSSYTFKHTLIKTYQEGIKGIEKNPHKFLVIVVDDARESRKAFNDFIKRNEEKVSRSMYNGYDAEKDRFNFYLATEKDKALISGFKVKEAPALIFLNANGELIYHTEGSLADNSALFYPHYSVYDELKRANEQLKLDKLVNNKKASLTDFKKSFLEIINTKKMFNNYYGGAGVIEEYDPAIPADTVAAVPFDDYEGDYLHVDNPENLYSIKTPKETITAKWKMIVDFYAKNNTYDEDFIEMCKKELHNRGFMYKLYGGQTMVTETDFRILDYLYKNYSVITGNETEKQKKAEVNEYGETYAMGEDGFPSGNSFYGISSVLSGFFQKMTAESAHLHRANQIKLIGYYKSFLQLSGYKLIDFSSYLERIKETNLNDNSLYFREFQEFFDGLASKNTSLIESLDEMYAAQKTDYVNWLNFKHEFSRIANNVAWMVVESKNNDGDTIQKAIKWSEASLKVTKNEFHYLDTLAQLYYKNNQKEKAIATEQLAIDNLNPNDKERKESYGAILESMKNGTY